jgi:nickel-type superoxide dismutase maturation protease
VAAAVALGLGVAWAALRPRRVEVVGGSMRPALEPGDRLVVVRLRRPRPGDVVAVPDPREPGRLLVKRIAARRPPADLELRGDAPEASTDSRQFGPVPEHAVVGLAVYRYAPPDRRGFVGGSRQTRAQSEV